MMYSTIPNLVLGFHGCDKTVADQIIGGKEMMKPSVNNYDWLGNGLYFWENDPERALDYARFIKENPGRSQTKIEIPAVIGAVIDLGYCLNLLERNSIERLAIAYKGLKKSLKSSGLPMPQNLRPLGEEYDVLLRKLDCAVIEYVHHINPGRPYDSVRAAFWEGEPAYPDAGIMRKNHIQICIRNTNCIRGFFYPLEADLEQIMP